jgi:hypothetical protein
MATRSTITLSTKDGYKSIYCHYDGYLTGVGTMLQQYYDTQEKVEALIALGSLSSLSERLAPAADEKHTWEKPVDGVTVAYHRDRGEELSIRNYETLQELDRNSEEYNYLFENDTWYLIKSGGGSITLIKLALTQA